MNLWQNTALTECPDYYKSYLQYINELVHLILHCYAVYCNLFPNNNS